ncbi:hypothetical protein K469DRAFT_93732 [Zopfia rhizophila CBS 207.26]|uniref:Uncharacterized protein n=1 Tax=Zopfia rhizophila CBS 207.26 TaxID=1314779 RepID=A0A6A6EB73_9PEZI|nr:hypothetical protein K469DRAFT_93732 [Zopfia rhizophila CBS 207.26]
MGGPSYTVEQLQYLRNSPLVQKPDGLPSIEQWMDLPADQNNNNNNNRRPRSGIMRDGDTPSIGENRSERPLLINAGMGHFGRRSSTQPEDTVLGPPKLSFTSASRTAKSAEHSEKRTITSLEGDQFGDRFPTRERWTRDRDNDRNRDKPPYTNGRRTTREDGEGWTNVKSRKSLGQDDLDRGFGRSGDRDRDRHQKDGDTDNADGTMRRTGMGKFESRWGRRDDTGAKEGDGSRFGSAQGGWRERERDRERDRDRDWNRNANKVEEDPEWMDSPVGTEKKQAHTQEDFQRWKERMKAKDTPAEEKEEPKEVLASSVEPPVPTTIAFAPATSKPATPMGLDGDMGKLFGVWGKEKAPDAGTAESTAPSKAKAKQSKFAKMFSKGPEEPPKPTQAPLPTPASPEPGTNGSNEEDKEGFQRILQMLGGASISATQSSQQGITIPANGTRQGGVPLEFQHQSPPDEPPESMTPRQQSSRTLEQHTILENILAPRPSGPESRPSQVMFNAVSPEPESGVEQFRPPRPESNRPGDEFPIQQPPSRNNSAQGTLNLHAILNGRTREDTNRETKQRERDFLLTLMQQPSRATPPQLLNQNMARPPPENQNLPPFFDTNAPRPQGQPKGRGMPPGFMDDPRIFAENEMMMRRDAERREASLREMREAQLREASMQQQETLRKSNPRLPPGIFHDEPPMASLQRRNTAGEIPRQMTNMGIPSQPVPDIPPYLRGGPGMPQPPQDRNIAPPPGFGGPAGMRQPPGFGGPQGGPPQQIGPFSTGNTPLGHPPGMPPPRGMGGMFPNQGPQGPPQGYFPPPGFAPPMGMRGGVEDPRMMMGRPDFEQFGGPGQSGGPRGQVGRPPGMPY